MRDTLLSVAAALVPFIPTALFYYSSRRSLRCARELSRDLHEAHTLIVRAMRHLRDHDDFDSRYTYNLLHDYMEAKLKGYGLPEVPPLPRRAK